MTLPMVNTAKYSVHLPGCGKDVEYRPFFVKEQKILMQASESEDPSQITIATNDMLKACTFEKLDIDDLTGSDVEYLLLKIRTKSVGETSEIVVKCMECEEPHPQVINLDKIVPIGDGAEKKVKLNETIGVCFKMPTIKKLKRFMQVADGTAAGTVLATMGAAVDYVYDDDNVYPSGDQQHEEIVAFLESLSAEQYSRAQEAFTDFPKLSHTIEFTCKKCGHENNIQLGGVGDFLR